MIPTRRASVRERNAWNWQGLYFGVNAGQSISPLNFDVDGEYLRFFDYHLKGIDDGIGSEPPIRFWVLGEGGWRHENKWPLARTRFTDYFLHSGGNANSIEGDGFLSTDKPGVEKTDVYLYDPLHPTPSAGGQICCYPAQLPSDKQERSGVLHLQHPNNRASAGKLLGWGHVFRDGVAAARAWRPCDVG